jgi:hypothetical protein
MRESQDNQLFPLLPQAYSIRFPDDEPDTFEIRIDNEWKSLNLRDREQIFTKPGLYEQLVCDILRCHAATKLANLFLSVLHERDLSPTILSVLDLGASNGVVAEEMRRIGVSSVVGIDPLPEARDAAERDRWGIYDDYIVSDLSNPSRSLNKRLIALDPDVLVMAGAPASHDVSLHTFAVAFNAVRTTGWLVLSTPDVVAHDSSPLQQLLHDMVEKRIVQLEASRRYVHSLNPDGRKIERVAVIARKLTDLPDDMTKGTYLTRRHTSVSSPLASRARSPRNRRRFVAATLAAVLGMGLMARMTTTQELAPIDHVLADSSERVPGVVTPVVAPTESAPTTVIPAEPVIPSTDETAPAVAPTVPS